MRASIVLFAAAIAAHAPGARADELIWRSDVPSGYAYASDGSQIACYGAEWRRPDGSVYRRERECGHPAQALSDIGMPLRRSPVKLPPEARHVRILPGGVIQLY